MYCFPGRPLHRGRANIPKTARIEEPGTASALRPQNHTLPWSVRKFSFKTKGTRDFPTQHLWRMVIAEVPLESPGLRETRIPKASEAVTDSHKGSLREILPREARFA